MHNIDCAINFAKAHRKRTKLFTKNSEINVVYSKLVKLAVGVLAAPLSKMRNNSISKVVFRNEANIALVSPLDAETPAKDYALNYRSVSVLPIFSKIFGSVIKTYLMKSMGNYFLPHLSARFTVRIECFCV